MAWTWTEFCLCTGEDAAEGVVPEPVPVAVPPTSPVYVDHVRLALERLCEYAKSGD